MNKIFSTVFILTFFLGALLSFSALAKSKAKPTASEPIYQRIDADEDFETYETAEAEEIYDPYENVNRKIFALNDVFDRYFAEPIAKGYRSLIPRPARNSVRNFLNNLASPISGVNSLMQGKVDNSLATFSNFFINSTIGIGGLFDVAGQKGIIYKSEDFGQTLGHYGTKPGAYLLLPVLGPSTIRDFGGWSTDTAIHPLGFNLLHIGGEINLVDPDYRYGLAIMSGIDMRESLIDIIEDIRKDSFDPYATIRSAYMQKRATDIKN